MTADSVASTSVASTPVASTPVASTPVASTSVASTRPAARPTASDFPSYTAREVAADRVVHLVGVPGGLAAAVWLVWAVAAHGTGKQVLAAALYGAGLVGMLAASAAYNMTRPGPAKALLRRLDYAMIFVMIAGSYTPFALGALPPGQGWPLFGAAWAVAALGVGLKLRFGNRHEMWFVALYLAHGWMILPVLPSVVGALAPASFALLGAGALVYTAGVVVYTRDHVPFHNAAWHVMVLLAAGLHLGAISRVLGIWGTP